MAESLGGSRGRNDNGGTQKAFGLTRTQGRPTSASRGGILDRPASGRTGGGILDRPSSSRPNVARTGGMAAALGGRPASAPRERPQGDKSLATIARVSELRRIKEAQYWNRPDRETIRANTRDLPAFWSVREHGQPFNDERLASGVTNLFRLKQPSGLASQPDGMSTAVGPATMQQAALRMSLETGKRHFTSISDLKPLPHGTKAEETLTDGERGFLLGRLTPYQRIHALRQCLDKDKSTMIKDLETLLKDKDAVATYWIPWPLLILNREALAKLRKGLHVHFKYNLKDWFDSPDMLMKLAIGELEFMMRRHLKYMSDELCNRARAPAALGKDILRKAFWRVDPQKTGVVSIQQFLQVWQNLLVLIEYEEVWVSGKDLKGKPKKTLVLKPRKESEDQAKGRKVLLDCNMAAALFVKYGFDKEGLMPYVVYINALCETPSRLLGHEVILNKTEVGKNGLEDDLDISMCLGNAKIDYRYCKSGVFPPGEFSPNMGRRSFKPPKGHMWLDHVYGYAGMLEYTRQSNIFYTHNTGKPLRPETEKAVVARLLEAQGSAAGTAMRVEQLKRTEFVYYTGSVGIVFDKEKYDTGLPCQRYFFGHDNDIQCLAIHPSRKFVATGQQKATGPTDVPYVCVWDVDHCMQLQRLDHDRDERGVIALCFSGDVVGGKGGDLLLTVTADDKHTIHVWRWLPHSNKYINAHYIPGWYLGPNKKIVPLRHQQAQDGTGPGDLYFTTPHQLRDGEIVEDSWLCKIPFDKDNWEVACRDGERSTEYGNEADAVQRILAASREPLVLDRPVWEQDHQWWKQQPFPAPSPGSEVGPCPMWSNLEHPDLKVRADDADGMYSSMRPVRREGGFLQPGSDEEKLKMPHMEQSMNGCNGTPPMVYGVVWNRLRPSTGRKGSEFASYGVKHLRVWIANDEGRFIGTPASFGNDKIENILSAVYVPAMHASCSPGDSCLLTGFASGKLGLWVPPYPTRVGAVYTLTQHITAHGLGKQVTLVDGTQVNGGVRALSLRQVGDGSGALEVLSGGADGTVKVWRLEELVGPRADGTPSKGVKLSKWGKDYVLAIPGPPLPPGRKKEDPPLVVALDSHASLDKEFLAGTDGCDIWEVDEDPRILVEGHEEDLDEAAVHPECPFTFATACNSGKCRVWDARRRDVVKSVDLGYKLTGIAYSQEPLQFKNEGGTVLWEGFHLAVSGDRGELTVLRSDNMQPMVQRNDVASKQGIPEMKYSPEGGPKILAAASADQYIYLYRADRNYQLACRCAGHSCTITHVDWSLPLALPGTPHNGKWVLQASDTAGELLYWDPLTGKKLPYNLRDAEWHTWTLTVGFPVMGIWPDGSDGTDINSVDRGRLGNPVFDMFEAKFEGSTDAAVHYSERDSGDGITGAGFLVTSDDCSLVKMFNYPVVADDAPFKAFRGHASHVSSVRFMADDQRVVSIGGHDRGIYQWRTCGVASGLPPLNVIYRLLRECDAKSGGNEDSAKDLRTEVWNDLYKRARAFRSYERLKLYAMRVAIEEKRTNSAAIGRPQPKVPDQMEWVKVPGSANQFGFVPRKMLQQGSSPEAVGGNFSGGVASTGRAGNLAGKGGSTPGTPRKGSQAATPRASAGGAGPGVSGGSWSGSPAGLAAATPRASVRGSVAGSPAPSVTGAASQRPPSAGRSAGGGGDAAAAVSVAGASNDLGGFSGEVGSYELTLRPVGGEAGGRSGPRYNTESAVGDDELAGEVEDELGVGPP